MNNESHAGTEANDDAESPDNRQLSAEDMARVERYLSSPVHSVKRKPFRPWLMVLGLVAVMTVLSLLSLLISRLAVE